MKWLRICFVASTIALVLVCVLVLVRFCETMPFMDKYASHATVVGLLVSVVGFMLTVGTVLATLRLSRKAQADLQRQVELSRRETSELLHKIRAMIMEDTCDQALSFAGAARDAVRERQWFRAAEKSQDARSMAQRLLAHPDLLEEERGSLRGAEELRSLVSFIERTRLGRNPKTGLSEGKVRPLDSLLDELEKVRSRLQQQVLEERDADRRAD